MGMILPEISLAGLLNPSDPEEAGADVVLWMGPEKEPVYAHSNILRNASDYYKAAFSSRWKKATKELPIKDKEKVDAHQSQLSIDTVGVGTLEDESATVNSMTLTESIACSTPTQHSSVVSVDANSKSKMYEIHHPEYEKRHMIQVLHYMYRVPTIVDKEDALDVAFLANHLLVPELQEKCLSYVVESAKNVHKCAFKLYLLAATVFSESKSLMPLALEVIYRSFELCISAIPDVASLGKREIEALIVGLPFSAKQKWILLIIWAMASTGMIDDCSENPIEYVFKDLAWKEKVNDSFKQAVKDMVQLIPFPDFSKSDYEEYVRPFKDLGVLEGLNLKDFLICLFEAKEPTVQDPQLLADVKQQSVSPSIHLLNILKSFPQALSMDMINVIAVKTFLCSGKFLARMPKAEVKSDVVIKNGVDCRPNPPLKNSPYGAPVCLHVFSTKQGSLAVVIADTDQKMDYMIYRVYGIESTFTQNHKADRTNCRFYASRYDYNYHYQELYTMCECRECPTYVEMRGTRGQVRYPRALEGQKMQDYIICYFK